MKTLFSRVIETQWEGTAAMHLFLCNSTAPALTVLYVTNWHSYLSNWQECSLGVPPLPTQTFRLTRAHQNLSFLSLKMKPSCDPGALIPMCIDYTQLLWSYNILDFRVKHSEGSKQRHCSWSLLLIVTGRRLLPANMKCGL
ncbi:hypothetical protein KIL84_003568 [Mauremys mutica]|uniref:Uncharacterized protein n=1 Tax=Mauremys mutica TaxID=74926 RepID=A0A9D3WWC4_9SAUR|nr:hypothetical protein KIL84_003568 [Mauremys mutica]